MTESEITSPPVLPPVDGVTVIDPVEGAAPPPGMVAVIVALPTDTAVAKPAEFTVATAGALELQATMEVTSSVVAG